ncbi:Unknown protein, partial [Striga hermonthica]
SFENFVKNPFSFQLPWKYLPLIWRSSSQYLEPKPALAGCSYAKWWPSTHVCAERREASARPTVDSYVTCSRHHRTPNSSC